MRLWFRIEDGGIYCPGWYPPVIWSYRASIYLLAVTAVISQGEISMYADLDTYVYAAIVIGAFFGALIYSVACYLNRYQSQKLKSARILAQAASEKRELTDEEKQQTSKTDKFQGVYLGALILDVLMGAGLAAVAMIIFGDGIGLESDAWAEYGALAFLAAFALAVVFEKWFATPVADGKFDSTKQKFYDTIVEAAKSADTSDSASAISDKDTKLLEALMAWKNSE